MTPSPGPIQPHHAGAASRVIQGSFPGGRPNIIQASPAPATPVRPTVPAPVHAPPASPPLPIMPGRPVIGAVQPSLRPGQPPRPILPARVQPGAVQPAAPRHSLAPQPILPQAPRPAAVQPQAGHAFALPANFTLKPRGSGQPLPEPIQKKMESFFNTSFADVRVHVGPEAASIGALAFTHGTDLYFAPGQYNPQSTHGQQQLGHELTHVVQQRAGRVRNPLGSGVAVVQDPALEAEAERMGMRAVLAAVPIQAKPAGSGSVADPLSRPATVAANGAILPVRAAELKSVQRRPGPILAGRPSVVSRKTSCGPASAPFSPTYSVQAITAKRAAAPLSPPNSRGSDYVPKRAIPSNVLQCNRFLDTQSNQYGQIDYERISGQGATDDQKILYNAISDAVDRNLTRQAILLAVDDAGLGDQFEEYVTNVKNWPLSALATVGEEIRSSHSGGAIDPQLPKPAYEAVPVAGGGLALSVAPPVLDTLPDRVNYEWLSASTTTHTTDPDHPKFRGPTADGGVIPTLGSLIGGGQGPNLRLPNAPNRVASYFELSAKTMHRGDKVLVTGTRVVYDPFSARYFVSEHYDKQYELINVPLPFEHPVYNRVREEIRRVGDSQNFRNAKIPVKQQILRRLYDRIMNSLGM